MIPMDLSFLIIKWYLCQKDEVRTQYFGECLAQPSIHAGPANSAVWVVVLRQLPVYHYLAMLRDPETSFYKRQQKLTNGLLSL